MYLTMYITNYELLKGECENWKKNLTPGKKLEMCFNFSFLW